MGYKASNNADTTLSESITQASTAIAVATGRGDDFPTLGATDWTLITITDKNGAREIIKIIARDGDTMTVGTTPGGAADAGGRAQEGTTALSITYTDDHSVRCCPTAGLIEAIADYSDQGELTATPAEINTLASSGVTNADLVSLHSASVSSDLSNGFVPIGAIIAYVPGYFTNGSNAGFTYQIVSENTVAAVNALLNSSGWYVCDGAALNDADSGIFNGVGRYLPNLTDDRFLMGDTVAGGIGGANTMAHTHTTGDHTLTIAEMPIHNHKYNAVATNTSNPWTVSSTGNYSIPSAQNTGSTGGGGAHNHGPTGVASNTENRPSYLSCFYIMRVK